MQLYGLKNCDTCRAARKALPDAEFVDVRDSGVPPAILSTALDTFGEALVNRKSTTWRGLDDAARARPPLELLQDNPTLMKRPLIVDGDRMVLGWTKAAQTEMGV
ncbi:ArsC/Spx/MgsR family protein [Pseudooceanicola onchidii]|uniref:ArsC/Spx/MgsR family protein n=1 Tax=Pseudooceanicola onchidii TaxID=2562279 RepID=UPI0010AA1B3B|nr:ArsC/Spx/MgsR family protein [Pseudooceanicola onchidii]